MDKNHNQQLDGNYKKFFTKYTMLCEYLENNDNVYPNEKANKQLFNWVRNTRRFCKNGKMEERRVELLKKINFPFSTKTIIPFDKRIIQLLEYKKEHGSLHVSQTLYGRETDNYKLSRWVNEMRRKFAENRLGYKYVVELNNIGFLWNMDDVRIEKKINALKRFYKIHGHYDIPQKGKYKKLGNWVAGLRSRGIKTIRHKKWLDDIGFVWVGVKERKRRSLEKMNEVDMKVMSERLKRNHRNKIKK
ncbi:MAG: helicase associated domain-containing protein [Cyclobacteriaceae bacterium]|nr:helicase associated domain-containing protein [Cyclobacteriaceae bacterium]